ncbi:MAG: hypothetical protein ACR2IE_12525 [Candidatus Sumerlaeaceae bacterium]
MESIFDRITVPSVGYGNSSTATGNEARPTVVGSTGLVASVEAAEFERLVKDAVDPVVLAMAGSSSVAANGKPAPPRASRRYAMSCSGVVFVTQAVRALQFSSDARVVECQAIVYENKPLG